MNILILGAGTVGTSIAELLCAAQQNVCVVDSSAQALSRVEEQLDVQTVHGSAVDSVTLFQAGVLTCDLCLAVTSHDEVNLIGASLARAMGARRTVARIFNRSFLDTSTFDYQRHFQINRLLSLEYLTALELAKSIRVSGLYAVENFARGAIEAHEVVVQENARAVNVPLRDLELPRGIRIGLIANAESVRIPGAESRPQPGDRVTLIGARDALEDVNRLFEQKSPPRLNIIIAGGGEIGYNLAALLEKRRCNVILMEADQARCEYLARKLEKVTVLHADATQRSEMEEARVSKADVFVAATGHDEDNIVCGVEARELGSRKILSIVRRPDYANVLEKLGIDAAVSPREVMARQVLGMLGDGTILGRTEFARGAAEVWEVAIRPEAPISRAPLREIDTQRVLIAAVERDDYVQVPGGDDQLKPGDTAIVLVPNDGREAAMQLFQPAAE